MPDMRDRPDQKRAETTQKVVSSIIALRTATTDKAVAITVRAAVDPNRGQGRTRLQTGTNRREVTGPATTGTAIGTTAGTGTAMAGTVIASDAATVPRRRQAGRIDTIATAPTKMLPIAAAAMISLARRTLVHSSRASTSAEARSR